MIVDAGEDKNLYLGCACARSEPTLKMMARIVEQNRDMIDTPSMNAKKLPARLPHGAAVSYTSPQMWRNCNCARGREASCRARLESWRFGPEPWSRQSPRGSRGEISRVRQRRMKHTGARSARTFDPARVEYLSPQCFPRVSPMANDVRPVEFLHLVTPQLAHRKPPRRDRASPPDSGGSSYKLPSSDEEGGARATGVAEQEM